MANVQSSSTDRQSKKSSNRSSQRRSSKAQGPGRGWHGDPEGHARAGSQSHKNK